jgi:hypothetical protein
MKTFVDRRCFVHPAREAVCLCTVCANPHCRECVTDRSGRLVCAACERRGTTGAERRRWRIRGFTAALSLALALLLAWLLFYTAGRLLVVAGPGRATFSNAPTGDVR